MQASASPIRKGVQEPILQGSYTMALILAGERQAHLPAGEMCSMIYCIRWCFLFRETIGRTASVVITV
jgi:hypothetical protein